jgi:hypothetical protein
MEELTMNNQEIISAVHNSMYQQIKKTGYASTEQVLMDLKYLSKEDYEKWRFGKVDYLERVCKAGLHKLNFILSQMQAYARTTHLKESFTYYKRWGRKHKEKIKLRFTKTGNEFMERRYATRYVACTQNENEK